MASVSLKHIFKRYPGGVTAVNDFCLEIKDKEFIILVGPSGCGKSTTLRMIAGLEEITEGELYIGDRIVNDVAPKDRDIAMVFQNYALYPHMTVFENMAFGLKLRKTPKDEIKRRVEEAARILDIDHLLDRKPKALSGGQRQRVALGRAIVREPKVFLLDEPLSNLDAKLRAQMRTELSKLHQRLGTTFIYVMKEGILQQVDTPTTLYNKPCNVFVAGFIGSPQMNFIEAKIREEKGTYYVEFGSEDTKTRAGVKYKVKLPESKNYRDCLVPYIDKDVIMGIRPEHVHDEDNFLEKFPEGIVEATVDVTEMMGAETYLYMTCEGQGINARVDPSSTSRSGDVIKIAIDPTKIHIFDKDTEMTITN